MYLKKSDLEILKTINIKGIISYYNSCCQGPTLFHEERSTIAQITLRCVNYFSYGSKGPV